MRKVLLFAICLLMCVYVPVYAQDYTLQSGESTTGAYAGAEDYNYYQFEVSKSGFIAITAKTSDKQDLLFDICNEQKQVIASDIVIPHKGTVLHRVAKGNVYYLRVKGTEGATYELSYEPKTIPALKYAKKYSYTFTNASFTDAENAVVFKMQTSQAGILHFMSDCSAPIFVKYLNSGKSEISEVVPMNGKSLTGIGVQAKKTYYVSIWNEQGTSSGTTTLNNIKYQVGSVSASNGSTKAKAAALSKDKYREILVPAGTTTTSWFKLNVTKKQKLNITVESHMMQNNEKNLRLYICNKSGKKLNSNPIVINGKAEVSYNKKYIMKYPKTTFETTAEFPAGIYYIRVESPSKTSSGAYKIKWK